MFTSSKGQGRGTVPQRDAVAVKPEFTTLNKDGKPVWEPGLPAEVTSRRVHKPVKKEAPEEAAVPCDLRNTLKLPPPARADWLDRALRAIPQGRAKVQDVFNVVTHPKFVLGLPEQTGRKMLRRVAESLDAFSEKQRTTLVAKCKLAELFQASAAGADGDEEEPPEEEPPHHHLRAELPSEEPPPLPPAAEQRRGRSWSRPRRHRSPGSEGRRQRSRSRRSRSRRRAFKEHSSKSHLSPTRDVRDRMQAASSGPSLSVMEEAQVAPTPAQQKELGPEERAMLERALLEQQRQREEDRKKLEADRRAFEERERQRKAKLGSAFLVDGEQEEDDVALSLPTAALLVRKGQPERTRVEELPYSDVQPSQMRPRQPVAIGGGQDVRFVEAMGGDKILAEAHAILQRATESGRVAPLSADSPSRGRRRRSNSRRNSPHVRSSGSYRSPTPDGRARGQARAARKAKMIACLMGLDKPRSR